MSNTVEIYHNLSNKRLLLVAENFGLNFSGGSTATAKVLVHFENVFSEIFVLCKHVGIHELKRANIINYNSFDELPGLIELYSNDNSIGFGDYYIAKDLAESNIPYVFVYHDNFPELENLGITSELDSKKVISTYGQLFSGALEVFSVTMQKLEFIRKYTNDCSIARNGLSQRITKLDQKPLNLQNLKILMAGNIDQRKYKKALEVFTILESNDAYGIQIDILGHEKDECLKNSLVDFNFVSYLGFKNEVNYNSYDLYMSTSMIENLSLSVVDALANNTPVLSFNIGGISEIVNRENGVLIKPFDSVAMANAIFDVRDGKQSFNFKNTELHEFDWDTTASKMLNIINEKIVHFTFNNKSKTLV